ncbi:MAG TPA: GTP 3',8-cyclase MoaA [Nitrospirota bacterium]|nr:GTP 3',8-cyclase MoaA [Nitrospirota bacterium]
MALTDSFARRIDYLRISVTDRCNLACIYCKPHTEMKALEHSDILTYEEILRLVTLAARLGISHVRVTGGEPFVRLGVVDFIAKLGRTPGIEDVSVTTNGVLLADMAEALVMAGKPRLNISLDSLKADRFREITGSDTWDAVWRGINKAEALGFFPLKLNMVPVGGVNDDEIVDFARLTLKRRLHVRFIEFMPIGAHDRWHKDVCISSDQARSAIEREFGPLVPLAAAAKSAGPSANFQIPGAAGVIGFISPISKHFCDSCRRLRLTADGKIRPCLLSDTEIDIKSVLRSGSGDAELERTLRLALEIKPERHRLVENPSECFQRSMSKIGG